MVKFHLLQNSVNYRKGIFELLGFLLFEQSVYFSDCSLKIHCKYFVLGFSIPHESLCFFQSVAGFVTPL